MDNILEEKTDVVSTWPNSWTATSLFSSRWFAAAGCRHGGNAPLFRRPWRLSHRYLSCHSAPSAACVQALKLPAKPHSTASWTSCSARALSTALGTNALARWQRGKDICLFFGGHELTVVLGTNTLAPRLPKETIFLYCSGRGPTAADGMKARAWMPRETDTLASSSGHELTSALGTSGLARWQRGEDIWVSFNGHAVKAFLETRKLALRLP